MNPIFKTLAALALMLFVAPAYSGSFSISNTYGSANAYYVGCGGNGYRTYRYEARFKDQYDIDAHDAWYQAPWPSTTKVVFKYDFGNFSGGFIPSSAHGKTIGFEGQLRGTNVYVSMSGLEVQDYPCGCIPGPYGEMIRGAEQNPNYSGFDYLDAPEIIQILRDGGLQYDPDAPAYDVPLTSTVEPNVVTEVYIKNADGTRTIYPTVEEALKAQGL